MQKPAMLIIGLTGGIGSGKSTVARFFAELGVPVVDADVIARTLVTPGQPARDEIVAAFGEQVLDEGGQLDRGRLRRVVFSDPEQRARLEAILHPRIRTAMAEELARIHAPYCIVCIPLLVESAQKDLVHRVLVVDAPEALQYARIRDRDELSNDDISAIMSAQATRGQRLAAADDIIVNDGDLESLQEEVARLHRFYCEQTGQPLSH